LSSDPKSSQNTKRISDTQSRTEHHWLIVMHWLASGLGGYLTGRLRTKWAGLHTHEVFFRDTANGFLSWAVASVVGAVIVTSTAAFVVSGTAAIATGVAGGAANGAMQLARTPMPRLKPARSF
jgi:hypothetical protein